jgi:hypothetical protein
MANWTFYGADSGLPGTILGASMDEGGNLWVAGGEAGLFVLRPGETKFQQFTMADGLHPYGSFADGGDTPPPYYLNVLSVAGGPSGVVYVGYQGRSDNGSPYECEDDWVELPDGGTTGDPSIYKSGDADKVTLNGGGISVVHYDIFSGPGVVKNELAGRERLCNIWRVKYEPSTQSVWFGGNHGIAWGDPDFQGAAAQGCLGSHWGNPGCSGVLEHVHPAFAAYPCNTPSTCPEYSYTEDYRGVASDGDGGMWFGGANRSLHYDFGWRGANFYNYMNIQFDVSTQIDIWPDAAKQDTTPSQRVDDLVSAMATPGDGTVWVSSFTNGVAHLDANGNVLQSLTAANGLADTHSTAIFVDPADGSIWVGANWGGLTRLLDGQVVESFNEAFLGKGLVANPISDIQVVGTGATRQLLVSFRGGQGYPGAVGLYSGP